MPDALDLWHGAGCGGASLLHADHSSGRGAAIVDNQSALVVRGGDIAKGLAVRKLLHVLVGLPHNVLEEGVEQSVDDEKDQQHGRRPNHLCNKK